MLHFKKKPGDIIILHLCTKNLSDMIYSSWDIERGRLKLVILGHFLPFYLPKNQTNQNFEEILKTCWIYHHFTQVYQKPQSYHKWFRRNGVRQTEFFVILGHFLPFPPTNDPENQNFENKKKIPWDILLQMCTINEDHMMYGSWNIRYDTHNFLLFWTIFCPFTPWQPGKLKFWKIEKNTWRYC